MTLQFIIPVLVFVTVVAGISALLTLCNPYWIRVSRRVRQLDESSGGRRTRGSRQDGTTAGAPWRFVSALQRLNPYDAASRPRLQQRLARAGIYDPAVISRYFAARILLTILAGGVAIIAGAAGYLRIDMAILAAGVLAGFGSLAPSLLLERAIARHRLLLRKSLPDFLDLMTVCLEAGLSLQETIRRVSQELRLAHPALAPELEIVQRDIELGATVDQALKRFGSRADSEGVRTLSTFMREAQRFGTNITEALRNHAELLRAQREQSAEERAQKASVKILLPTLLLIFPAVFVVLVGPAIIQIQESFANQ